MKMGIHLPVMHSLAFFVPPSAGTTAHHIIWNPRTRLVYLLYNFRGATMTIRDSLLMSIANVKKYLWRENFTVLRDLQLCLKL